MKKPNSSKKLHSIKLDLIPDIKIKKYDEFHTSLKEKLVKLFHRMIPEMNDEEFSTCKNISRSLLKKASIKPNNNLNEIKSRLSFIAVTGNSLILDSNLINMISTYIAIAFSNYQGTPPFKFSEFLGQIDRHVGSYTSSKSQIINSCSSMSTNEYRRKSYQSLDSALLFHQGKKPKGDMLLYDELSELSSMFINIKTVTFTTKGTKFSEVIMLEHLLVLVNFSWLFKNILEVKFEFTESTDEDIQTIKCLNCKHMILTRLLVLFYSQSGHNIRNVSFKMLHSFQSELNVLMQSYKLDEAKFHIVDLLLTSSSMINFEIEFNSIDPDTFQHVLNLLSNKRIRRLKRLAIKLFPSSSLSFSLIKTICDQQINESTKKQIRNCSVFEAYDRDESDECLKTLFTFFEVNLEFLFYFVTSNGQVLQHLTFNFDLPEMLTYNDKYVIAIHNFLIKLMLYIESTMTKLQSLDISSLNVPLDGRKYPNLLKHFTNLNLRLNQSVLDFRLGFKMNKVPCLTNLLPASVECLTLGELDLDTLNILVNATDDNEEHLTRIRNIALTLSDYRACDSDYQCDCVVNFLNTRLVSRLVYLDMTLKLNLTNDALLKVLTCFTKNKLTACKLTLTGHNLEWEDDKFQFQLNEVKNKFVYFQLPRNITVVLLTLKRLFSGSNFIPIAQNTLNFIKMKRKKEIQILFD